MSLQTIINRVKMSAFFDEIDKLSADIRVTDKDVLKSEVIEARKALKADPKEQLHGHLAAGALSGVLAPGIKGVSRAIEQGVNAPMGTKLRMASKGFKSTNKGELVSNIATGMLTASVISAGRRGLQLQKARELLGDSSD